MIEQEADYMTRPTAGDVSPEVAQLAPWFHNLHLPDGSQTAPNHPLGDFPAFKWREIGASLPEDLNGWSVLDIGCNAGFYSIELAKRGAHVTGIDCDQHFLTQARWAAEQFGLSHQIEFHRAQVYDLARWDRTFDLVLFLGVFYHLRYPLLGLDIVAEKVGRQLLFQALMLKGENVGTTPDDFSIDEREIMDSRDWPKMAFVEKRLAGDGTNWWIANDASVQAMLRSTGMKVIGRPAHETYLCMRDPDAAENSFFDRREFLAATGRADL